MAALSTSHDESATPRSPEQYSDVETLPRGGRPRSILLGIGPNGRQGNRVLGQSLQAEEPIEAPNIFSRLGHAIVGDTTRAGRWHDHLIAGPPIGRSGYLVCICRLHGYEQSEDLVEIPQSPEQSS
jgi:hypothetical protein